ncbi:peptidase S24/S26A/S26B/S26C [Xylariales sp. PMI_506]|nr:peptidase S24/S26A/S26B/S26C [Xylariales sp. PMI_506]
MTVRAIWARMRASPGWRTVGLTGFNLYIFATWIPVVIWFNTCVADTVTIRGASMYPFFNAEKDETLRRDRVLNWKFKARENLARGMVVTLWSPVKPEEQVVKRIVGLEGDVIKTRPPYAVPTIRVPPGHVWVEGDAGPTNSVDSNTYGPVSTGLIIGKVTHILYPFHRAGQIRYWEFVRNFRQQG